MDKKVMGFFFLTFQTSVVPIYKETSVDFTLSLYSLISH